MTKVFESELPDGYKFADKISILPEEIIRLRESVRWIGDKSERWQEIIHTSLAIVGVRDINGELIGMACLAGNIRHAVMCDLAVDPEHQKQGIGEALMAKLDQLTNDLGVKYVYAELAKTNPFRNKMIHIGFRDTGDSLFRELSDK